MAIYHLHTQVIGRSSGKSVVASAAYRSGEKIHDEHIGQTFDYTRKQNIDHTEVLAPGQSPDWVQDRAKLWNEVEMSEKRKDAQLARELNIALPRELGKEQQIEIVRNYAKEQFVDKGMIADISCHNLDGENPHAHIMLTTREVSSEGFGKKDRSWNNRELHNEWRKAWADHANKALEKSGSQERIDHRSLKEQGIQRDPQIHVGPIASAMEKKGIKTDRGEQNRKIINLNEYRELHRKRVEELNMDIKEYNEDAKQLSLKEKSKPTSSKDIAIQLESNRMEYIKVTQKINELSRYPGEAHRYERQIYEIKDNISEIQKQQNIVQKAEQEKSKLGIFKGKEKKEKQATIDRGNEQIEKMKLKLKNLGIEDMAEANRAIALLQSKANMEREMLNERKEQVKQLKHQKEQLKGNYQRLKDELSPDQRAEVEKYQSDLRQEQKIDISNLDNLRAINNANRELDVTPIKKYQKQLLREERDHSR